VTIQQLTGNGTYVLDPAATSRTAFLVRPPNPNPRGEYFLLENRQGGAAGLADSAMIRRHCQTSGQPVTCPGGLLIWHVDSAKIATSGFHGPNTVNVGSIHGLVLEEADGVRQLWCCNRGDAGDPYNGTSGNTAFVYRTNPVAARTDGSFAGLGIDQITPVGTQMSFRLQFGALTAVRGTDSAATIQFDASSFNVFRDLLDNGSSHTVGFTDQQVNGRTRWNFQSWSDGGAITHTIAGSLAGGTLTATLLRDFKLTATGGPDGSIQATDTSGIDLAGGTFIREGRTVTLTATPDSGQNFGGWSGDTITANATVAFPMGRAYTVFATFGSLAIASVSQRPNGVMGGTYLDTLKSSGGTGVNSWAITGGAMAPGLTISASTGVISGFPHDTGTFNFTATVASGAQIQAKPFSMSVTAPNLAGADVVMQLLGPSAPLNADQTRYLDFLGNNNNGFDVGDFLAWLQKTGATLSPAMIQALQRKGGPR